MISCCVMNHPKVKIIFVSLPYGLTRLGLTEKFGLNVQGGSFTSLVADAGCGLGTQLSLSTGATTCAPSMCLRFITA